MNVRRYRQVLVAVVGLGLALRLTLAVILPPGYDESYYLFYGQNLALSYFDHPLAVGVWAWLGLALAPLVGGDTVLALRLPGLLSYSAALVLLAEATRVWFGRRAALIAAALGSLSPLLLACGGLLLLPDSPLILLLSLLLWWLARHPLNATRTTRESLLFGLILGGLSLCKYHALLLILTLVLWRLIDSLQRRHLRWGDTALVWAGWLAGSWPLWLWNLQNGWVSFLFHSGRTTASAGFRWEGPPLFLLSQLALLFPTIAVVLLIGLLRPAAATTPEARAGTGLGRRGRGGTQQPDQQHHGNGREQQRQLTQQKQGRAFPAEARGRGGASAVEQKGHPAVLQVPEPQRPAASQPAGPHQGGVAPAQVPALQRIDQPPQHQRQDQQQGVVFAQAQTPQDQAEQQRLAGGARGVERMARQPPQQQAQQQDQGAVGQQQQASAGQQQR